MEILPGGAFLVGSVSVRCCYNLDEQSGWLLGGSGVPFCCRSVELTGFHSELPRSFGFMSAGSWKRVNLFSFFRGVQPRIITFHLIIHLFFNLACFNFCFAVSPAPPTLLLSLFCLCYGANKQQQQIRQYTASATVMPTTPQYPAAEHLDPHRTEPDKTKARANLPPCSIRLCNKNIRFRDTKAVLNLNEL